MIKANIKETATKNGVTTAYQLQKLMNLQPSQAAKLYRNDLKMIGFDTLNELCKVFNCTPNDILAYVADDDMVQVSNTKSSKLKESNTESSISTVHNASDSSLSKPVGAVESKPQPESNNEYSLTSIDAGKILDLNPRTVREYAEKKLLHGKQGKQNHWFFRRVDLLNFKNKRDKE